MISAIRDAGEIVYGCNDGEAAIRSTSDSCEASLANDARVGMSAEKAGMLRVRVWVRCEVDVEKKGVERWM